MAAFDIHSVPRTEAERWEVREVVKKQTWETVNDGTRVTCPCGHELRVIYGYRCLYCGVIFCKTCAKVHFGQP